MKKILFYLTVVIGGVAAGIYGDNKSNVGNCVLIGEISDDGFVFCNNSFIRGYYETRKGEKTLHGLSCLSKVKKSETGKEIFLIELILYKQGVAIERQMIEYRTDLSCYVAKQGPH